VQVSADLISTVTDSVMDDVLVRLEPTALEKRSRRSELTAREQLSLLLDNKAENRPAHKKADTSPEAAYVRRLGGSIRRSSSARVK
jgi:hypothetical protein